MTHCRVFNSVVFLLIGMVSFCGKAEERVGRIYSFGSSQTEAPLFVQRIHREQNENGELLISSTIADQAGVIVMREKARLKGKNILSQQVDQLQLMESYELDVADGKVFLRKFKLKGELREKVDERVLPLTENFLTGPVAENFLKLHLMGRPIGEKVTADFGVFEFLKSVSFSFRLIGKTPDGKTLSVRMRPESFWLSMLVDPIEMEFDSESFFMKTYRGRTPLRIKSGQDWKAFDAVIVYTTT